MAGKYFPPLHPAVAFLFNYSARPVQVFHSIRPSALLHWFNRQQTISNARQPGPLRSGPVSRSPWGTRHARFHGAVNNDWRRKLGHILFIAQVDLIDFFCAQMTFVSNWLADWLVGLVSRPVEILRWNFPDNYTYFTPGSTKWRAKDWNRFCRARFKF